MNYCSNCGIELEKNEKVCPNCNTKVVNLDKEAKEGFIFAICSIFCWIIPLFGLLTSIPGLIKCSRTRKIDAYKKKSTIGFIISIVTLVLTVLSILIAFLDSFNKFAF